MGDKSQAPGTDPGMLVGETKERILQGAARIFAELGYARATTKVLSEAAGVNEVTLFRHFGSKEGLFSAVTERFAGPAVSADLEAKLTGDYARDLLILGTDLFELLLERGEVMRMLLCEAAHFPEVRKVMARNPREIRLMLARYFQQQIKAGQVRPAPPEVLAQAFVGMFFSCAVLMTMLGEGLEPDLPTEALAAHFVSFFVSGTEVRP